VLSSVQDVIELGGGNFWASAEYLNTQIQVLRSRNLAKRVVDRMGLSVDDRFLGLDRVEPPLSRSQMRKRMTEMDAVSMLLGSIEVNPQRESRVVIVAFEHNDPALATEIVNTYVEEYRRQNLEMKKRMIQEANEELEDMLDKLEKQKTHAEERVLAFEQENGVGSLAGRKDAVQRRLQQLNEMYQQAKVDRIGLESSRGVTELQETIGEAERMLRYSDPERVVHPKVVANSEVAALRGQLTALKVSLEDISVKYGERHPKYISLQEQATLVKKSLRSSVQRILNSELVDLHRQLKETENRLSAQSDKQKALLEELRAARQEESSLLQIQREHEPLVSKRAEITKVFDYVKNRYAETTLVAQVETNNVRIQDLAIQPKLPIKPNLTLNLMAGVLLSILLSLGAAFFVESLDNTIRDRSDVENISGVRFLGILPSIGRTLHAVGVDEYSQERDLYPLTHPKSSVAEQLRSIQTNIMYSGGVRPRVLLVVSPSPREGKTTVACQLGITMAMSGLRTVVIDTDMRRPRLHKAFGLKPKNGGVASYLIQGGHIGDYILPTQVPGLDLLGCGIRPPNPIELVQAPAFGHMVEELKRLYDLVLFDSPPLLAVADSRIIVTHCDQVVCVSKSGRTTRDALKEARDMLWSVFPDPIGCVVNDVDISSGSYHYYYYYGRKYGYYATPDDIPDEADGTAGKPKSALLARVRDLWRNRSV
jgi:capsular exopolysaccharide synthesis family protein